MKRRLSIFIGILCLCFLLCLCGCSSEPVETAEPTSSTQPTESTQLTTDPTDPPPLPQDLYSEAKSELDRATQIKLTISHKTERTVGGETYRTTRNAVASYASRGTDALTAQSEETLILGTYETKVTKRYLNQTAYQTFDNVTFSSAMSAQDYSARELPAALLDAANYKTITVTKQSDSELLSFSDPTRLEDWLTDLPEAQLISAKGTATLDADGNLTETTYTAEYTVGSVKFHVEISVRASTEEKLNIGTDIPTNLIPISGYDAPILLLQAVGDIFTAKSVSSNAQELLVCNAAALVRSGQTAIDLSGSGSAFMANVDASISVTNYTGQTSSSTQTETFRDGSYRLSTDGGAPTVQTGVTAEIMRSGCEDLLLANLFTPEYIQSADISDTGDFYLLRFTGNTAFIKDTCEWVYTLLGLNLDDYASSYNTVEASGYLAIDKISGLPTSLGQYFKRSHIIENVSYDLIYDCNQSLNLSSATSYKTITGVLAPETPPAISATPLFYQVTGKDGQIMYLLGTIHIGDARTAYLPQPIYDAFNQSDALAVEMDVNAFEKQLETDTTLQQQIAAGYYFTDGKTVANLLDPELYKTAKDLMLVSGNYSTTAEQMKPALWENAISNFLLQQSCDLISDKGVDQRLLTLANDTNKPILNIEDPVSHALVTTRYSQALQAYLLKGTLEASVSAYRKEVTELYELWCKGDEKALSDAISEDNSGFSQEESNLYAEYYQTMITDRNAIMLQKAQEYMESGDTVFFAVGLAHVVGPDGLAAALRAAGYTVEAITYN